MFVVKRSTHNPILTPNRRHAWEAMATFNWSPIRENDTTYVVYRAMSFPNPRYGSEFGVSTIGFSSSQDGVHFAEGKHLIKPEMEWERFGCEDPRIAKIDDTYYIFYTALSQFPFNAEGIRIAVATMKEMGQIDKRHPVTPFNAKAMTLFPEKINGKITALLTVDTDRSDSKIAVAQFDTPEDMWNELKWHDWYDEIESHKIDILRSDKDLAEVGAAPIRTEYGWLVLYAYIQNYHDANKTFGIEALLLDENDPRKILGRTQGALLVSQETYEEYGYVPGVVFPSGALTSGDTLEIYYGAADTVCAIATTSLSQLTESMVPHIAAKRVVRSDNNPILVPREENAWESKAVFNPAAIDLNGVVHIVYRALGNNNGSVLGYAASKDGLHIDERLDTPIYTPRESFENKAGTGGYGCEDPRIVLLDDNLYMLYTAYDGVNLPAVALSHISVDDFLSRNWNWSKPELISHPGVMDKDACLLPERIDEQYMIFHREGDNICADFVCSLDFEKEKLSKCIQVIQKRHGMWDSKKVGIAAPPFKTKDGWVLFYHGVGEDNIYRVGAALLDLKNPTNVIAKTSQPILQPEYIYEKEGLIPNVVFPCGSILRDGVVYIYYGGADTVVASVQVELDTILAMFR